jgi:uncharacterized protein (TIGR02117 family)
LKAALRWVVSIFALIALVVAGGALIPRPLWRPAQAADAATTARPILVLSNLIHTDIAIPLNDAIRKQFGFLTEEGVPIDNPGAEYLVVGWGGRSFYLETPDWADIKPLPVFRALTIDRSVMHVAAAGNIREDDPAVIRLVTNDPGLNRMLEFILASFTLQNGEPAPIPGAHYGRYDAFYEANGSFNALVGCNTWTSQALREAGLRTGAWNPAPQTLAISLKLYN